jgi:WD40 repeat protein
MVTAVAFSPDGRFVLTGSWDDTAALWDTAKGTRIRRFRGYSRNLSAVALSPDGRYLATAGEDLTARLWDTASGAEIRELRGHTGEVYSVAFSPDSRFLLTGSRDNTARLWDTASGAEVREFRGHTAGLWSVAFSPDGRFVLTGSMDKTARLWDAASGAEIRQFQGHPRFTIYGEFVNCVAFSADGRYILTGGADHFARMWDAASGELLREFQGHSATIWSVAFSPDGRFVLTGSQDRTARLWDPSTGTEIRRFQGHTEYVNSAVFSPDGRFVLTASDDRTARLWDAATGAELRRMGGHPGGLRAVTFSPDGRLALSASRDGTVRLWQPESGKWLATLTSSSNGAWAVVDPEGRYDAPDPDRVQGLYWRVGAFRTIGLAQLRRYFYTPGLLAAILREGTLPPVKGLNDIAHLPPVLSGNMGTEDGHAVLQVQLSDIDAAGYGRVTIRINGRPFSAQPVSRKKSGDAEVLEYRLDEARFAEGANRVTVSAASSDNLIESNSLSGTWNERGAARGVVINQSAPEKAAGCGGRFYGIFVGAGTFPFARELYLKYPENDAKTLAEAVRLGAESLCGKDRVEITTLTTDSPDKALQPTKENIRRAFQTVAAKSSRKDLLFVYLAGHGATPKRDPQSYFYLTQEARQVDVDIADKLRDATTISGAELVEWLINPNLPDKQVLILDTCAAAAANVQLAMLSTKARSVQDDLHKAVDNWNLDTGTYILMGSARDRASYESDRFHHGLLTYALLRGMKGDALLDGSRLEAARWFETAIPAVEKYAAMIGREQKPVKGVPSAAGGVPVGFFPTAVRDRIVVTDPAPEILKLAVCFQEPVDGPLRDPLKLRDAIRSELRSLTGAARGGESGVSYDDNSTEGSADALTPQVRYRAEGAQLKVTVSLLQGEKPAGEAVLTVASSPETAAKAIAARMLKLAAGK